MPRMEGIRASEAQSRTPAGILKIDPPNPGHPSTPPARPQESHRASFWAGIGFIALSAAGFSTITTFSQLAYKAGTNPLTLIWLRFICFALLVGPLLIVRRKSLRLPRQAFLGTGWLALTMMMMSVGYLSSVVFIPVSLAVILLYTFPLMVGIMAPAFGRERLNWPKGLCLLGAFAGLVLAIGPSFDALDPRGVILAIVAALGVAIAMTFGGRLMAMADSLVINFWTNIWMLTATTLYIAAIGGISLPGTGTGWLGLGAACFCYVLGYTTMFAAMKRLNPTLSAVMLNLEPPLTIGASIWILGETLSAQQAGGVTIMLISIAFSMTVAARVATRR